MRKKKLKFWSICMTIVLTVGLIMPNQWYSSKEFSVQAAGETSTAQGIHVDYHSKEEIADYLKNQGITLESLLRKGTPTTTYEEKPVVTSPYQAGCMSKESKEYALKVFNSVRYIAGISEVEFYDKFEEEAQYAAMINAANDEMSHEPVQPKGMPEDMYQIAYTGSSCSNLAWDSINSPFAYTIVHGWIWDSDERNADGVGHRRWMLNPNMEATGFGQAESESGRSYRALFATSLGNKEKNDKDGVAWPAQNTPIEYFDEDSVWSISLKDVYSVRDKIKVILTDLNSQKNWEFSTYSKTGLFGAEAACSAREDFIYFRPEEVLSYQAGDSYKVEITGLSEPISYTVNFFSLESMMGDSGETASPGPAIPENVYMAQGAWTGWGGEDSYPSAQGKTPGYGLNNYYYKDKTNMAVSEGYNCGLELMNPYNAALTGADNEMAVFIKKMKSPVIRVTTKNGSAASGWNWNTELSLPSGQEVSLTSGYLSSGYFAVFGNDDTITKVEIYDKNQENGNDNIATSEPQQPSQETPVTSEPQKPDGNAPVTNAPAFGTTDQPVTASPATDKPSASPVVKRTATPSAISYRPSYTKNAPSKPGRVNLKKVKALRRGRVKVTWNKVYGANEYQVQYSARRSFAGKRMNTAYGKSTYLYLRKKKTYYVRVRAVKYGNSANNYRDVRGSWSTVKKVKTKR